MKVADGVEMLELLMNVMGTTSIVCPTLISDNNNFILIDTGYPGQLQQIRDALEKVGIGICKLNKIIITHHDIDHIGCLAAIVNENQGKTEVYSHEVEKPYIQGDIQPIKLTQLEARLDTLNEQMKSIYEGMKSGYKNCVSGVDGAIVDGLELPYCGGITVIHTPGHTPGHISLYLKKSKTLISGDTLFIENGQLIRPQQFVNFDNDLALESIKKFTNYDIENIICYHGGEYKYNPNQRISELVNE